MKRRSADEPLPSPSKKRTEAEKNEKKIRVMLVDDMDGVRAAQLKPVKLVAFSLGTDSVESVLVMWRHVFKQGHRCKFDILVSLDKGRPVSDLLSLGHDECVRLRCDEPSRASTVEYSPERARGARLALPLDDKRFEVDPSKPTL